MRLKIATLVVAAAALLGGCVSAPFDATTARMDLAPLEAAQAERAGDTVIWGGMIVEVVNRTESSELVVLGYPLDSRLRPLLRLPTVGRFIAAMPGYVEPYDLPQGRFVTVRGTLAGTREALIDERPYVYPVLSGTEVHLWPIGFQDTGPHFSFGIGISN